MPWNLLLFPLLGGFLFLHVCDLFRFRSQRFESERLLLHSASYGVAFGVAGRFTTYWLSQLKAGREAQATLNHLVSPKDAPYLGTAIAALGIGWFGGYGLNLLFRILDSRRVKLLIVEHYDDTLLRTLYMAMYSDDPVSLTLSHRKVYVGYLFDLPNSPHNRYLTLMLLLSGYRDERSMEFVQTINYADRTIIEQTPEENQIFTITLPLDEVVSANVFDLALYEQEFAERLII